MAEYEHGSYTIYDIKYHFEWLTKYRYKVLTRILAVRLRELLIQVRVGRGYFYAAVISITKETVRNYIEHQFEQGIQKHFKIENEL